MIRTVLAISYTIFHNSSHIGEKPVWHSPFMNLKLQKLFLNDEQCFK